MTDVTRRVITTEAPHRINVVLSHEPPKTGSLLESLAKVNLEKGSAPHDRLLQVTKELTGS